MALLCSQQLVTGALWAGPPRWQLAAPSPSLTGSQVSLVRKPGQASSPPRRGARRYIVYTEHPRGTEVPSLGPPPMQSCCSYICVRHFSGILFACTRH